MVLLVSMTSGFILSLAYQVGNKKSRQSSQPYSWLMVVMPPLLSVIIFIVEDNFLRALYLLAATTLIRFRNPVKNPLTTVLLLAAVGTGACTGFHWYSGSILLALTCLFIVWVSNYVSITEKGVTRILCVDFHSSHHPEMILKGLGKYVRKWSTLSLETSPSEDRFYCYYAIEVRREDALATLINKFESVGIRAHIINPQYLKEF